MLKSLFVKDYVLIEEINVEFSKGLNIITGETGAGKSILIDAMSLLLGERASSEVIRKDTAKAIVEGIFDVQSNKQILQSLTENNIDSSEELILRREIPVKGNNRCFVNDTPVSLTYLKEIGNYLVDLHGQHEHQSLLRTETHIDFLDQYADLYVLIEDYRKLFRDLQRQIKDLKYLREKEREIRDKKEFYAFQIKEIDSVNPLAGEEEELNNELKILENSEKLLELTGELYLLAYDSDDAAYDQLVKINSSLNELVKIDHSFSEVLEESQTALNLLKDLAEFIRAYNSKITIDPDKLETMRSRISTLQHLKKKYGGSISSIIEYRNKIGEDFSLAENFSEEVKSAEENIKALRITCGKAAEKISSKRVKAAVKIKKEVTDYLSELGIPGAAFEVKIKRDPSLENNSLYVISGGKNIAASFSGVDIIEFFISTNPGEDLKPLVKVASGGEVSRIMLALKSALANNEKLPLLIFDEIDTGISGRIAQKVGKALKNLSSLHQIIAITHLPQIAGQADTHYVIEKSTGERAVSSLKLLGTKERILEVAKLMSGTTVTEVNLKGAKELMGIE